MTTYSLNTGAYAQAPLTFTGEQAQAAQVLVQTVAQTQLVDTLLQAAVGEFLQQSPAPEQIQAWVTQTQQNILLKPDVQQALATLGGGEAVMQAVKTLGAENTRLVLSQELDMQAALQSLTAKPATNATTSATASALAKVDPAQLNALLQTQWLAPLGDAASYQAFDSFVPLTGGADPYWRSQSIDLITAAGVGAIAGSTTDSAALETTVLGNTPLPAASRKTASAKTF